MIRKLNYLTAAGRIKSGDSLIYCLSKANEGKQQVKKIRILEDGTMSGTFGSGFFDEAETINLSLARLGKDQGN